ncbi:MAG: hypothetical protein MUF06_17160 [Pirellulaceae bacterium]|jgi:hypothetical protein|nr:hypothetical protein [Pirellulaceae bacterium]
MFRSALCLIALLTPVAAAGCGGDGLNRGAVAGRVTLGGAPLAKGRILFVPVSPNSGPAASAIVVDGQYTLDRAAGPIVGQNRVEVEAELDLGFALDDEAAFAARGGKPLPPNPIPPAFNKQSTLAVEIQAGETTNFDVAIPAAGQTASAYR